MSLVSTPLKKMLRLKEIPIHECGPDCLCWQLIEMAGGQAEDPRFPFDARRNKANREAIDRARSEPHTHQPAPAAPQFSNQDLAVLKGIRDGMSNRQISEMTVFTPAAINQQIRMLMVRLNLRTREEMAIYYSTRLTASSD